MVTGDVNPAVLDDLVRLCVELDQLRHRHGSTSQDDADGADVGDTVPAAKAAATRARPARTPCGPGKRSSKPLSARLWAWSRVRAASRHSCGAGSCGARLGGPSLPLDVGVSKDIPAAIRHAVILRDKHCQWTGGCDQPASACEVHHLTHKANGGKTSVKDCILFCWYHHQVVIHRMGWTVVLHPDGTTTAWNREKTESPPQSQPSRSGRVNPGGNRARRVIMAGLRRTPSGRG